MFRTLYLYNILIFICEKHHSLHTHNFVCNSPNTSFLGKVCWNNFQSSFFPLFLVILKKKNLRRCSTFHYIHGIIWNWDIDSCTSPKKSFLRSLSKNDGLKEKIQIMNFNGRKCHEISLTNNEIHSHILSYLIHYF